VTERHVFKLNKQYKACDRQPDRIKKIMVEDILLKTFGRERRSERAAK
jgi:hypothetical protein